MSSELLEKAKALIEKYNEIKGGSREITAIQYEITRLEIAVEMKEEKDAKEATDTNTESDAGPTADSP